MIVVTGSAGFIASYLVDHLNALGHTNLVLVDDFSKREKEENWINTNFHQKIERSAFIPWFEAHASEVDFVFHLGARTDTTEKDLDLLDELNLNYTKSIWQICTTHHIPLVYASSAATYGLGEYGHEDNNEVIPNLKPLNPYGISKNEFDKWAITQENTPPFWAGLKFFNVYGPKEYHKGRMASVVFHTHRQIKEKGHMQLFRSHHPDYKDGEQLRDFVYVKDVAKVCEFLMQHQNHSGIYNLGSGKARTFLDLASLTFQALGLEPSISFIDTPIDIRDKYQYFTEANMSKLKSIGYPHHFYSLEEGINDYVKNYLEKR
ncbi:MAG: ADP-glyceromanno-heptose 6-epimerase [Flavobacteriales bacterium]